MRQQVVSVYVPTRNRAELLHTAITSVLKQSYQAFELLVSDDGSSDRTPDLVRKFEKADSRVKLLRSEQARGAPSARNDAILAASGTFITGLDDDDAFLEPRLAALVGYWRLLEDSEGGPPSCLYTQEQRVSIADRVVTSSKRGMVYYDDLFDSNWIGNQVFTLRDRFIDIGLFDPTLPAWQDLECFMRLTKRFGPARLLDAVLYRIDETPRENRITTSGRAKLQSAFERVAAVHASDSIRKRQRLMLQLFAPAYHHRPKWTDFRACMSGEIWPAGVWRLLKARYASTN